jgi:hypothetical protein
MERRENVLWMRMLFAYWTSTQVVHIRFIPQTKLYR